MLESVGLPAPGGAWRAVLAEGALPEGGTAGTVVKIVVLLALVSPWLYLAPWVQKDARRVLARVGLWSALVLAAGTAGLVLWLVVPVYLAGMLIYLVMTAGVFGAYVVYRNGRVKPSQRVLTGDHLKSLLGRSGGREVEVVTKLTVFRSDGRRVMPPTGEGATTEERLAYNQAQELLFDVLWRRASEADLSPAGREVRLRYLIDGVIVDRPSLEPAVSELAIQHLKVASGLNPEERRRPQQGKVSVDLAGKPVEIFVIAAGTTGGQRMQLRIAQEAVKTRLDELGMAPEMLQRVREMGKSDRGLILVSGRPGSGVTSTLYSLLRQHDAFTEQLVTLEASPRIELENVTQHACEQASKLPEMLASVLRRDPDVVLIDPCPDAATAAMVQQAAGEKLMLVGLEAPETFVALARWVQWCGSPAEAVKHVHGVLSQLLLRKLCTQCREAYRPDPNLLAKANLSPSKIDKFYRPPTRPQTDAKGQPLLCPACQGSGYFGRTAAFEFLDMTDEVRRKVAENTPLAQIKAACRKSGMLYLQEQALTKVIEGQTSIQEVIRVTQQGRKQ